MSSGGGNGGGAGATSEEWVVARYKARFVISALGVGAIALAFEVPPVPTKVAAPKHSALIYIMRVSVTPRTLGVLARWLSVFRIDDLTDARFDDVGGK
jgi:hypothetical protein